MPNNNAEYWANRFAMLKDAQYKKADEYVKELEKVYRQIRSDLEKDLAKWYNRLAENNEVSLAEAKRMLDNEELEEFKWTVEQYIERASDAGLARKYMKELENASARVHIRRLEAMELQIEYYVALLMNSEEKGINELLSGLYSDTYYQAIYEMQKGSGIGAEFTALNTQAIENIMLKPWADDGLSFGKRIRERYGPEFVSRLGKTLSRSLISGDSQRKLSRSLEKDFDLAKGQAERLIQTESAFFIEAATLKSYEETGVDEYKILATLDYKTSEICRSMDGKVFSRKDAVTGVNYPPFHCRCRTTTVPLTGYEDMFEPGERVARNADGDIYYVPEDMTYPEWYKKYVESDPEEALKVKKLKNRRADKEQYERYKERLGKENVPETLDMWQEKKYTDDEWYGLIKDYYKSRGTNMISAFTTFDDYCTYKQRIEDELVGLTTSDGVVIKSQSKHFIERVFGTSKDPYTGRPRSGVELEDIKEALLNGNITVKHNSVKYKTSKCEVSMNPKTGNLIQTNPK